MISSFTFAALYFLLWGSAARNYDFKTHLAARKEQVSKHHEQNQNKFDNFKDNIRRHQFLNRTSFVHYGPTKFSHLSQKEFEEIYLTDLIVKMVPPKRDYKTPLQRIKALNIPPKLDWRFLNKTSYKYVSPVKNQNRCGGCWAFSSIETVETMYAYKHDIQAPELSVQEVIDCAVNNEGCAGGDTCLALKWTVKYQPIIVSNADYPLTDTSDYCKLLTNTSRGIYVSSYTCDTFVGQEDEMLLKLYHHGPLTVAVDASTWNHYLGGIIQYHCEQYSNHAVQIVGYDLTGDIPYYIVRNSWGTDFGIDGYLYIKIGDNLCEVQVPVPRTRTNLKVFLQVLKPSGIAQRVSTVTVQ